MRRWPVAVLLLVVFVSSLLLTMVAWFTHIGQQEEMVMERVGVLQGHVVGLLATASLWSKYPSMPSHLSALLSGRAFLITTPFLLIGLSLAHIARRRRFALQICACVGAALACYLVGSVALRVITSRVFDPTAIGPWLVVMVLGPLYALSACALICAAQLASRRPEAIQISAESKFLENE